MSRRALYQVRIAGHARIDREHPRCCTMQHHVRMLDAITRVMRESVPWHPRNLALVRRVMTWG